jgi:hypothetical protein
MSRSCKQPVFIGSGGDAPWLQPVIVLTHYRPTGQMPASILALREAMRCAPRKDWRLPGFSEWQCRAPFVAPWCGYAYVKYGKRVFIPGTIAWRAACGRACQPGNYLYFGFVTLLTLAKNKRVRGLIHHVQTQA